VQMDWLRKNLVPDLSSLFCTARAIGHVAPDRRKRPRVQFRLVLALIIPLFIVACLAETIYAESDLDAGLQRGVSLLRDGDLNGAESAFDSVLKAQPDHAMAHFHLGSLFFSKGRLGQAESHLNRAVEIAPYLVLAYLRLSEVYERKGDLEKAIQTLETIAPKIEDKTDRLLEVVSNRMEDLRTFQTIRNKTREGIVLFRSGKSVEAEARFREVLALQPKDSEVHRRMGVVLGKQGRLDEATEHFKASLDLKPDLFESRQMLVELYIAKDELDLARAALEKGLLFLGDNNGPEGLFLDSKLDEVEDRIDIKRLSEKWIKQDADKQIDLAIATLQDIIKIAPDQVTAYLNLGNLLAQKEQFDRAETFIKKAIDIDPDFTEAHQRLGQVYEVSRLFRLAHAQYEKGMSTPMGKVPPMKEILEQSILRNQKMEAQATAAAIEALAEGNSLLEAGDTENAILIYERAVLFHPEDLNARFQLALLYEQNGRPDLANLTLRLLIGSNPEFIEAQRHLASLDEKGGFYYQALKRFRAHGGNQEKLASLEKKVDEIEVVTAPLMAQARREAEGGEPMVAIETLVKAQAQAPDDPRIRIALGRLYTQTAMKKEAYEALNAAGFFEPLDGQANYFLGALYETGKQWRDAEAQYEKALQSEKISPGLRIKAEAGRRRAVRTIHDVARAERFYNRGQRHQVEDDHRSAIASYEKALGLFPDHDWSLYWTGWSYERLSDFKAARTYYHKALEVNPSHRLSLQHLGFVHEAEGEIEEAIRAYRQSIALWNGQENPDTDWMRNRLKPLEKRFFVDINQVLLSYDSNPTRSANPDSDLRSSIGIGVIYLLKKDRGLQIPIGLSTDNTFFFESNAMFSQETFRITAIRTTAPFVYSVGYNFQFGLARDGATGSDHVGLFNVSRYSKENSSLRFAYIFDNFISASNQDFDARRQTYRLTYDKRWEKHSASVWYQFLDNSAKLNDQASQTNGLGFSVTWSITEDFSTSLSYDIGSVGFDHIDSQGNKRRENILQSATLDASYRLQKAVVIQASYTEQRNSSNLSAGAVTIEQQLSGQSASLGDYSQRSLRFNINWSF